MTYKRLLDAGKAQLEKYPGYDPAPGPATLFSAGARWMNDRLNKLDAGQARAFDPHIRYNLYGVLKYGICLSGCALSAWWLSTYSLLLIPLSAGVFFLLEVNFLFLFPLLIDKAASPVLGSIRAVYRIGILKCVMTVIPIALFMVAGLFRKKQAVRNWYIGCLAVLIWYNHEVRNRASSSV